MKDFEEVFIDDNFVCECGNGDHQFHPCDADGNDYKIEAHKELTHLFKCNNCNKIYKDTDIKFQPLDEMPKKTTTIYSIYTIRGGIGIGIDSETMESLKPDELTRVKELSYELLELLREGIYRDITNNLKSGKYFI